MKKTVIGLMALVLVAISGCSSIATKQIDQRVPEKALMPVYPDQTLIYFSDVQSFPTPLFEQSLALWALIETNSTGDIQARSIAPELIASLVNNVVQLIPQMNEQYIEARRATGTVSRELYIVGFDDPAEVEAIKEMLAEFAETLNQSTLNNFAR